MPRDAAPLPSISADLLALTQAAESESSRQQNHARQEIERHQAYRRLFFRKGVLTADARVVLLDLAREAAIGAASPTIDHAELAVKEGKRRLLLYLFGRFELSGERLIQLEKSLMQEDHDA